MILGKLRPVGSKVPLPTKGGDAALPWENRYCEVYTRSGTEALSLAVKLAIIDRPDVRSPEVLMPAYGCPDLVAAVVAQGAKPVLVDLANFKTPRMDVEGVKAAINSDTVAVVAVGFLGIPEQLNVLSEVCQANNLLLIEDSAQCFPPESASSGIADLVILSFGRGKPINLMGGGALLIRKDHLSKFSSVVSAYRVYPLKVDFLWFLKRLVFNLMLSRFSYALMERMPFLQLGQTRLNLLGDVRRLDTPESLVSAGISGFYMRPRWQQVYDGKLQFLDDYGWVRLHALHHVGEADGAPILRYGLLAPSRPMRDQMVNDLNRVGIAANSFYGDSLPDVDGVASYLGANVSCPEADAFASRFLALPCHEGLSDQDVKRISNCFREALT